MQMSVSARDSVCPSPPPTVFRKDLYSIQQKKTAVAVLFSLDIFLPLFLQGGRVDAARKGETEKSGANRPASPLTVLSQDSLLCLVKTCDVYDSV